MRRSPTGKASPDVCRVTLDAFRDAGLLSRVMFGSDQMIYPGLASVGVANTWAASPTEDELHKVLWANAASIHPVSADGRRLDTLTQPK